MKHTRIISAICITLIIFFSINVEETYAAGSFSVSGGGSISSGGKGTVTITANDCAGRFDITVSGGGITNETHVFLDDDSTSISVTAPSSGSFTVTVTATDVSTLDLDPKQISGSKSVAFTVKSSSGSSSSGSSSSGSSSSGSSSSVGQVGLDSNNNLKSLTSSYGTLSPSFAAETSNYILYVEEEKETEITAVAQDSNATIRMSGEDITKFGEKKTIVVTAENSSVKEYTITYKEIKEDQIIVTGQLFTFASGYDEKNLPSGLTETTAMYQNKEITVYESNDEKYAVAVLKNSNDEEGIYLYNKETEVFILAELIEVGGEIFILDSENHKLLYGDDGSGSGYYLYNSLDDSLTLLGAVEPKNNNNSLIIYIFLSAILFLLVVVVILQIIIISRKKAYRMNQNKNLLEGNEKEFIERATSKERKKNNPKNKVQRQQEEEEIDKRVAELLEKNDEN